MDERFSLRKRLLRKRTLISFAVGFVALYLIFRNIDVKETWEIFLKVNLFLLLLGFLSHYFTYIIRGVRWRDLLKRIGIKIKVIDSSEIFFLSQFVNCIVPAKLGDIYGGYLIKKNYGGTTSKSLGTIFVSRILDLVFLVVMLVVAGLLIFKTSLPYNVSFIIKAGSLMGLVAILSLIVIRYRKQWLIRIFPKKTEGIIQNFEEGTRSLTGRLLPKLVLLTAVIWLLEILRQYFVAWSLGFKMPFALAIFIALAVSLITSLPITPSGLGAAEAAIVGILLLANVDKNLAFSIAIMDRIVGYWSQLVVGIFLYAFTKK